MKHVFVVLVLASLCACGATPTVHSSFAGMGYTSGPTSPNDARLANPQFYRDEGDNAWWAHASNPGVH